MISGFEGTWLRQLLRVTLGPSKISAVTTCRPVLCLREIGLMTCMILKQRKKIMLAHSNLMVQNMLYDSHGQHNPHLFDQWLANEAVHKRWNGRHVRVFPLHWAFDHHQHEHIFIWRSFEIY